VLGEIVAEYRGHFLAHIAGNTWTDSFRDRLWRKLKRALMHEVAQLAPIAGNGSADSSEVSNTDRAADILHFIAERDPLAEDAYEALMQHYARKGKVAEALQIYVRCARTLEVQLGLEPSENLRTLAAKLRADRTVPASH
jgi:two-component SAPR family response regulator